MSANTCWEFLGIYSGRINSESDLGKVWHVSALIELYDEAVKVYNNRYKNKDENLLKIYCDTGGYIKKLKQYKDSVELIMFEYENSNKNINNNGMPANNLIWNDLKNSPQKIVGKSNRKDIFHLNSAFKNKCDIFLTSDFDDIYSKKEELEKMLGFKIFLSTKEWNEIKKIIEEHEGQNYALGDESPLL